MTINVGHPSNGREGDPTHHISLGLGTDEIGLICVDTRMKEVQEVSVNPYTPTATQIKEGRSKMSDKVKPFLDIPIGDLGGGLGLLHYDEDKSRYLHGHMIDTSRSERSMITGRATYTKGIREFNEYQPEKTVEMGWRSVFSGVNETTTLTFTVGATGYNADKVLIPVRKYGSPTGNMTVKLLSNADATLKTVTTDVSTLSAYSPYVFEYDWTTTETLSSATDYKIEINYSGGSATDLIQLWYDATNSKFPYRVLDDTAPFSIIPFEYRGGMYCITQPEDRSNSSLHLLGYRGLADSNSGDLTKLNDGTNQFTADELIGFPVKIVAGPGSEEEQTWRLVTDNEIGDMTVSAWRVPHTTDTEYVVTTDTWQHLDDFDFYCTDAVVADRVLLIAGGSSDYMHKMRWGNESQTWTWEGEFGASEDAEAFRASKLCAIPHTNPHGRRMTFDLYTARNNQHDGDLNYPNSVTRYDTPPFYGSPYITVGQLTGHTPWVGVETANVVVSADKQAARVDIAAGHTTGTLCMKEINPVLDLSDAETFVCGIFTSVGMDAGELELVLYDSKDNSINLDFPAVTTGSDPHDEYRWVVVPLHAEDAAPTHGYIDLSRIKKIELNLTADKGAQVIKIGRSGVWAASRTADTGQYVVPFGERINNLQEYGGGAGQTSRRPWIGTTRNVYYVEEGHLVPIYLTEIEELEDERNCELMGVNDVYLYFNIRKKLQRYYAGQLDNIGPEVDYDLPEDRSGYPCTMASYPGGTIVGFDSEDNTSWIGYRRHHAWFELYRSPIQGARIRKIHSLGRMQSDVNQLFVSEGSDILWLPVSNSPENDPDFEYNYHGHIETSRIYGTIRETEKYFHSLEVIQEQHQQTATDDVDVTIRAFYRTNGHDDYTFIADYNTIPNAENRLGSYDESGTWIQFIVELETRKAKYSPVMTAAVLDAVERTVVKDQYAYRVLIKDGNDKQLDGQDDTLTGYDKFTQLKTWVNQPLPLLLGSNSVFEDQKRVMLEPSNMRQVFNEIDVTGREVRVFQIILLEVE